MKLKENSDQEPEKSKKLDDNNINTVDLLSGETKIRFLQFIVFMSLLTAAQTTDAKVTKVKTKKCNVNYGHCLFDQKTTPESLEFLKTINFPIYVRLNSDYYEVKPDYNLYCKPNPHNWELFDDWSNLLTIKHLNPDPYSKRNKSYGELTSEVIEKIRKNRFSTIKPRISQKINKPDWNFSYAHYAAGAKEVVRSGEVIYVVIDNKIFKVEGSLCGNMLVEDIDNPELKLNSETIRKILFQIEYNHYYHTFEKAKESLPLVVHFEKKNESWSLLPGFKPKTKDDKEQADRLSRLAIKLERKYRIKIIYNNIGSEVLSKGSSADIPSFDKIEEGLKRLQEVLVMYHPTMIKRSGLKIIYLVEDLRTENGEKFDGEQSLSNGTIHIDLDNDYAIKSNIHHEQFHQFDENDGDKDNKKWVLLNPHGESEYVHDNGSKAIKSGDLKEGGKCVDDKKGYAKPYGYCSGPDEDQATNAEDLLHPLKSYRLLSRTKNDRQLLNKIEMMTGCRFDSNSMKFTRAMRQTEYKRRFKTRGFEYYSKWSQIGGKLHFDPGYWNMILEGKSPKFKKKGKTWKLDNPGPQSHHQTVQFSR